MPISKTISKCEVCDAPSLIPVLDLGAQPMCDDLVPIGDSRVPEKYPLRLIACTRCLTIHQSVQVDKTILFPQSYHYRAALTQDVINGMRNLVDFVQGSGVSLSGLRVLDVGCNDGSLLSIFRERGAITAGIEPTGAAKDATRNAEWIYHGYFDEDAVTQYLKNFPPPDIITFTNVFAHIEDLNGLIGNLKRLMGTGTKLVIENHYLGAVVARQQFDTFYHEHPRTYSFRSFQYIAKKLQRVIEHVEFPARYNGNIRVTIGSGKEAQPENLDEEKYIDGVRDMQKIISIARERIHARLRPLVDQYGPLPAKAFPGRAAILMHSLGIDENLIDVTYERSASPKIGHYIPGTRIEIRDEAEFFSKRIESPVLVNLAWHIQSEIAGYMRDRGFVGQLIPIFE